MTDKNYHEITPSARLVLTSGEDQNDDGVLHLFGPERDLSTDKGDLDGRELANKVVGFIADQIRSHNPGASAAAPVCLGCTLTVLRAANLWAMDQAGVTFDQWLGFLENDIDFAKEEASDMRHQIKVQFRDAGEPGGPSDKALTAFAKSTVYHHPRGEQVRRERFDHPERFERFSGSGIKASLGDLLRDLILGDRNIPQHVKDAMREDGAQVTVIADDGREVGSFGQGEDKTSPHVAELNKEATRLMLANQGRWSADLEDYVIRSGGRVVEAPPYGGQGNVEIDWSGVPEPATR